MFDLIYLFILRSGVKKALREYRLDAKTLEQIIEKAGSAELWDIARAAEDELIRLHRLEEARK